jgi:hypothetical protein
MSLAAVEVQNGFLVTFESFLNHFSASSWPNPSLILHMARSAGAGEGGSIDLEASFEISEPVAAIFAEKMLATRRKEEYQGAAQFCSQ